MTAEEQKALKMLIVATHGYYGSSIPDSSLMLQVRDLEDLDWPKVRHAFDLYRRNHRHTRPPFPAQIREIINPAHVSPEDEGREAAARIMQAITLYGWNHPSEAKEFIGELGWEVVCRDGGWVNVCANTNEDNLHALKAQWRDLAISLYRRGQAGLSYSPPRIPGDREPGLVSLSSIFASLPKPEDQK